jgi:ornithine carbamoyltransferase
MHFLKVNDYKSVDILEMLDVAAKMKTLVKKGEEHKYLADKTLGMIFEKASNRTRLSFEVGTYQLGGKTIYIQGQEIGLGVREPVADIARVLSRYVSAVMIRAKSHADIEELAKYATVPVINGLSDLYHPCQSIADMLTVLEVKKSLSGLKCCYIGDGNNVCNSLILIANLVGVEMIVACPKGYEPQLDADFKIINDPKEAVRGVDVIYTDVWTSMGQEEERAQRLKDFEAYTVNDELMSLAKPDAMFLHCLPAIRGEEVTDSVMESSQSYVFDQAENRMHGQKAVLLKLLNNEKFKELVGGE